MVSAGAFSGRQFGVGQFCIARIIGPGSARRLWSAPAGDSEAATPLFNLLVTVFFSGFRFVQACSARDARSASGFLNRQPG